MKRTLSLVLALAMILSMVPGAFAAEDQLPSDVTTLGSKENPEALEYLGWTELTLAADDAEGHYYAYTAEGDGTVTVSFSMITEGVEGDIAVTNKTTGKTQRLSEVRDYGYGQELVVQVSEGDQLLFQVTASAAADITWVALFAYVLGTELNPIVPEWVWNEETWAEATATVTAPVGTTYYAVYGGNGMMLTVNGEDKGTLTAMPMMPAVFSITNEGDAEAEYSLKIAHPVGSFMNPEQTWLGWVDTKVEANSNGGYYYTYTAEGDGTLTLYISNITEGVEGDIVVTNQTTGAQKSLSADGVDNNGPELVLDVKAGEKFTIQVMTLPDKDYNYPAADITWVGNFAAVAGSEQNPIIPEWTWNDEQTEATATVTVPVGTTYYGVYGGNGMTLTVNGEDKGTLTAMMPMMPAVFSITNEGDAEAEYSLKIAHPAGSMMNPDAMEIGDNAVEIAEGSQGYFFTWTAEEAGTLSIEMPADMGWTYTINNMTAGKYGDAQWSDSKPVVNPGSIEVAAGDEIQIIVSTYDPENPWAAPAGKLSFKASFQAKGGESSETLGDASGDGAVDQSDVTMLFAFVLGQVSLDDQQLSNADVNKDGTVDQSDVTMLFAYVLKGGEL